MPEQEPVHQAARDAEAIGKSLHTRPATVRDVAYGEGHEFSAGRGSVRLEIFPRTGVTRLTTPDARIELFGTTVSTVTDSGIEFARQHPREQASLTVLADADVVFTFIAGGERATGAPQRLADRVQTADHDPRGVRRADDPDGGGTHPPRVLQVARKQGSGRRRGRTPREAGRPRSGPG